MPIYEYRCPKCAQTFEIFHKITDKKVQKCGHCRKVMERLISQTSFTLKGEGWYKDGYTKPAPEKKEVAKKGESHNRVSPKEAK